MITGISSLSPLQCQLLTLMGLFFEHLPWSVWREILRASCGVANPDDAALDAAYRGLEAKKLFTHDYSNGRPVLRANTWQFKPLSARKIAAEAFGPIDFQTIRDMVCRKSREFFGQPGLQQRTTSYDFERELEYLSSIRAGDLFADRFDAYAEKFGCWPWESFSDESVVDGLADWPEPRPAPIRSLLLPWTLNSAFEHGRPAVAILDALAEEMPRHAALRCGTAACILAPLFAWAGRQDLLALCRFEDTKTDDSDDGNSIVEDENGIAAVSFARSYFGKGRKGAVSGAGKLFENGTIAQKALVVLNAAKNPPPKPMLERDIADMSQDKRTSDTFRFFLSGAQSVWDASSTHLDPIPPVTPAFAWLGRTMAYALSSDSAKRTSFPDAFRAQVAAEKAHRDGWTFLAAQLGGLLAQYQEVSERALALVATAPADEPLLWAKTEIAKPWDPIIEQLGEALSAFQRTARSAAPAKAADGEQFVATLALSPLAESEKSHLRIKDGEPFSMKTIMPSLARRLRGGGVSIPDKPCTWRALRKSLVGRTAGLSAETTAALDAWMRHELPHYGSEAHAMDICQSGRDTLLDILAGAGGDVRLRAAFYSGEEDSLKVAETIDDPEIEIRDVELVTRDEPDGSFTLSIPNVGWASYKEPLLVRTEPSRLLWWRVPAALNPFFALLRESGGNFRVIRIPAGGVPKAREMLIKAAKAGLPVRGAITPAGEGSSLPRVEGSARLVARLDRRDGSLRLLMRVRPVQAEPELLFPPGRGKAEIVVTAAKKPFLLARDRAAETAAADTVRHALSDFDGEREGENEWIAEGPERELALLEALRAASDAAPAGLDVEWRAPQRERTKVYGVASANLEGSKGADWWLGVTGDFRLDDGQRVALRDLIAALPRRVGGYLPLGERAWVRLSAELRRRLEALAAAGTVRGGELRVSPAALPMLEAAFAKDGAAEGDGAKTAAPSLPALPAALSEAAARISVALAEEHQVPEGLAARLRPYQAEGYEWLARLAACGLGGCLADDMGLGKTVQLLALLLARAGEGPSLVVAPASVCGNWCAEAARFAPGLRVVRAADSTTLPKKLGAGDLVVASYGILASRIEQFEQVAWNGAILDEAQAIKNADTQRAEAAKRLRAFWRFAATGTPVENRLSDLWSLFDYLNPGLLGSLDEFRARFLDRDGRPLPSLRSLVRPLVLRRLKGEVLRDLPPKTEITLAVEPDERERAAYEALRESELASLHDGDTGARMKILAALMRLRRFCCSPSLAVPGMGTGAKLEALEALLGDLRENGHRALVFSQFTDVLALVKPILERNGWGYEYLDGGTPQNERSRRVEAFQKGGAPFFLVSLKAGGTGLNLTAANYVVLLDPWWNPAVEDQAADRAHRIGQHNPVTVYRLVVRGTVEEKVVALHGEKRALAGAILDGTSDAALSENDLIALLKG